MNDVVFKVGTSCQWCAAYKTRPYGMCPNCHRFPSNKWVREFNHRRGIEGNTHDERQDSKDCPAEGHPSTQNRRTSGLAGKSG